VNPTSTFVDFLYFSVGGATTANFGDISPNQQERQHSAAEGGTAGPTAPGEVSRRGKGKLFFYGSAPTIYIRVSRLRSKSGRKKRIGVCGAKRPGRVWHQP
jgi:hypothetical protein